MTRHEKIFIGGMVIGITTWEIGGLLTNLIIKIIN